MKRNNLIIILGGVLAVLVLVFASLHTATVRAAHHNADQLSVQSITIPSRLTSAPTADSDEAPCYPGTDAVDPPLYPARAFLPLVVARPAPPTCANEVEPNDTYTTAQAVTAACVTARAAASDEAANGGADWYALRLCSPVTVTLRTTGALTSTLDLDLSLHGNPPGVPITTSAGLGPGRSIVSRLIAGLYYVQVRPAAGSGDYALWIAAQR